MHPSVQWTQNRRLKATIAQTTTPLWQHDGCHFGPTKDPWTRTRDWRCEEVDGSSMAWLGLAPTNIYTWKHLVQHVRHCLYCCHLERYPLISETLNTKPTQQGKISTLKGSRFTTHHYISTRPPLFSGTQEILSSLTKELIEISHLLTWHSEGFSLVPHRSLLFGHLFLFTSTHWSDLEPTTHWQFSHIISWCCLWEITNDKPYCHLKDKNLYSPNTINGHYQRRGKCKALP